MAGMLRVVRDGDLFDLAEQFRRARVIDALENSILLQGFISIVQGDERHAEVVMRGRVTGILANGNLILLHGFSVTLELVQRVAPLVVSLRVLSFQADRISKFCDRFGVAFEIVVTPREFVERLRVVRAYCESSFIGPRGFRVLFGVVVDIAEAEMRKSQFGTQSDRFLVLLDRFGVPAAVSIRITEFGMRSRVVGLQRNDSS